VIPTTVLKEGGVVSRNPDRIGLPGASGVVDAQFMADLMNDRAEQVGLILER